MAGLKFSVNYIQNPPHHNTVLLIPAYENILKVKVNKIYISGGKNEIFIYSNRINFKL